MNSVSLIAAALLAGVTGIAAAGVSVVRVPNEGSQPQALVDGKGVLHLIYFAGKPAGGDLHYVRRPAGAEDFGKPIRVNRQPGSAVAMGTIRGAQAALGRDGRLHVAWMGSGKTAKPAAGEGKHPEHPMLYTRLDDSGEGFEPERNVMQWTGGLDGGGSVAADSKGNVFVAWHGSAPDNAAGESGRAMFVAISRDHGRTFAREAQANADHTGSCGCCGMRAFVDAGDRLHLLYRAANEISRDMILLTSTDHGKTFTTRQVNQWITQSCPMSSSIMADGREGLLIGTEASEIVEWSRLTGNAERVAGLGVVSPMKAKHPAMAVNASGEVLVAWAEGAGWGKGGRLKWRLYDGAGKPLGQTESGGEIPAWSFPAAVAQPDGGFLLLR